MKGDLEPLKHIGFLGYSLETAIRIGKLYVRPNEIQKHLGRYAQRLVHVTDNDLYQFQHLGSATGIKYRDRYFLISTEHQRKLGEIGKLGIFCDSGGSVIIPSRMWIQETPETAESEDNIDFAIYEYEPHKYPNRHLSSQFFEIEERVCASESVRRIALSLGYPTRLQNVDYDNGEIDLRIVSSFVEMIKQTTTKDVYRYRTLAEGRFFEDGMSGAPVFEIIDSNNAFCVTWLGIVVRGGKNRASDA